MKRTTTRDAHGRMMCKHTMKTYVESMRKAFDKHIVFDKPSTPFPQKLELYKEDSGEEEQKIILEQGYRTAIGMMLWAARGVYPECMAGLSQLTRVHVLAYPSIEAWKAAMHMIQWMYIHRERGITFSQQGNDEAITFSDAFNKADEIDGKCMYGHVLMFKGGPIGGVSKKLVHIGNSAFHNEYMALRYAANITM